MANNGGGLIVFGVKEEGKAATERVDVGEFDENHERSLRSAAITAITPPVFNLGVRRLNDTELRAVIVEVPASVDGPHLVFKGEFFGAPVRNDADTVWMKERQIEAMYRARFDERRYAAEALNALFAEAVAGKRTSERAWLIAVSRPRASRSRGHLTVDEARRVMEDASRMALALARRGAGVHPLESIDRSNLRPGLRRWVAVNATGGPRPLWREAWASLHHDGSVVLAAAVGGHRVGSERFAGGNQVRSRAIECAIADLMALTRATGEATGNGEYEVRLGIEWDGAEPIEVLGEDSIGLPEERSATPLHQFTPVETTFNATAPTDEFREHVHRFAQDCVNQGGISRLLAFDPLQGLEAE